MEDFANGEVGEQSPDDAFVRQEHPKKTPLRLLLITARDLALASSYTQVGSWMRLLDSKLGKRVVKEFPQLESWNMVGMVPFKLSKNSTEEPKSNIKNKKTSDQTTLTMILSALQNLSLPNNAKNEVPVVGQKKQQLR